MAAASYLIMNMLQMDTSRSQGWRLGGHIVLAVYGGETFEGIAEHCAWHRGGMVIQEGFQGRHIGFTCLPEHPPNGLLHQVMNLSLLHEYVS